MLQSSATTSTSSRTWLKSLGHHRKSSFPCLHVFIHSSANICTVVPCSKRCFWHWAEQGTSFCPWPLWPLTRGEDGENPVTGINFISELVKTMYRVWKYSSSILETLRHRPVGRGTNSGYLHFTETLGHWGQNSGEEDGGQDSELGNIPPPC